MDRTNNPPEPKPRPSGPSQPGRPDPLAKPKDPASPPDAPEETLRSGIRWGLVASLVAVVLIAIFAVQNTAPETVTFLFWSWEMPLVVLILLVVLLSVAADEFITFWLRRRKRQQEKQAGKRR